MYSHLCFKLDDHVHAEEGRAVVSVTGGCNFTNFTFAGLTSVFNLLTPLWKNVRAITQRDNNGSSRLPLASSPLHTHFLYRGRNEKDGERWRGRHVGEVGWGMNEQADGLAALLEIQVNSRKEG